MQDIVGQVLGDADSSVFSKAERLFFIAKSQTYNRQLRNEARSALKGLVTELREFDKSALIPAEQTILAEILAFSSS